MTAGHISNTATANATPPPGTPAITPQISEFMLVSGENSLPTPQPTPPDLSSPPPDGDLAQTGTGMAAPLAAAIFLLTTGVALRRARHNGQLQE
ncbi:hypothetical protein LEP48_16955 [Isoptericola sp. NEAU-Y5]|uniref:Gram-positive cocci surface proteins LPxTG domain-containing protein n=1 Tax=Isoptericola luteus TaxID=2879484 RepID=A0ABS7ZJ16_9MICO|nr:hypothetical protein [Isoptericola sp. NEAU-Y5]MCA5895021.1 hypothetical protein [Isoptericola sp. NEAU-Y5]